MKSRKLVLGLLIMLAFVVSSFTYAFWAASISGNTNESVDTITIGAGDAITTSVNFGEVVNPSSTYPLVPTGRQVAGVTTNTITFTYNILWNNASSAADAAGATGNLVVTPVLTGLLAPELALFTVTAESTTAIVYGSTTVVTVTVTFATEPTNAAQYALVATQTLTLTITFLVNSTVLA